MLSLGPYPQCAGMHGDSTLAPCFHVACPHSALVCLKDRGIAVFPSRSIRKVPHVDAWLLYADEKRDRERKRERERDRERETERERERDRERERQREIAQKTGTTARGVLLADLGTFLALPRTSEASLAYRSVTPPPATTAAVARCPSPTFTVTPKAPCVNTSA